MNDKVKKILLIVLGLAVAGASTAIEDKKRKDEIKEAVKEYHKEKEKEKENK